MKVTVGSVWCCIDEDSEYNGKLCVVKEFNDNPDYNGDGELELLYETGVTHYGKVRRFTPGLTHERLEKPPFVSEADEKWLVDHGWKKTYDSLDFTGFRKHNLYGWTGMQTWWKPEEDGLPTTSLRIHFGDLGGGHFCVTSVGDVEIGREFSLKQLRRAITRRGWDK